MKLWDDDLEAVRQTIRAESEEFVGRMRVPDADVGSLAERVKARREAESAWVLRSDDASDRTIDGPAGPVRLREFRPGQVDGVMLHIHGGGWMTGSPEMMDLLNEAVSKALNLAIVSVDYRLAPENPYPAGPDDCESAALWLVENAKSEYGTDRLLIGGESAGAHLVLCDAATATGPAPVSGPVLRREPGLRRIRPRLSSERDGDRHQGRMRPVGPREHALHGRAVRARHNVDGTPRA